MNVCATLILFKDNNCNIRGDICKQCQYMLTYMLQVSQIYY